MKGYVYVLRSNLTALIYVGSTQSPLSVRMAGHRACFKMFQAGKGNYISSYDILEFGDAYIEALEVVEFNDKAELIAREGFHIRTLDCVNRRIEGRTHEEYYADNRDAIVEQKKKYYEENAEEIIKKQKIYYAGHVEQTLKTQKIYYAANAAAICATKANIVACECGAQCTSGHLLRHKKTAAHIKAMAALTA